ncbi:GAF domain-containing protein [Actinomadura fibrosa]|uniref:GAF domain-containing protein n=1 Tax=Actinomadura fibrosa TaxID=111802 RepID=A0ABW2XTI4_9ACTN|nr:GAF domain-containing protein [Actinomadura fibrosa]
MDNDASDHRSGARQRRLALADAAKQQQQRHQDAQQRRARAKQHMADARDAWRQQQHDLHWHAATKQRGGSATAAFWNPYLGLTDTGEPATGAVLQALLDAVLEIGRTDRGNVQLLDQTAGGLRITTHHNHARPFLRFFDVVTDQATSCGEAMTNRRPVVVDDVTTSPIFAGTESMQVMLDDGSRAVLSIPLTQPTGEIAGIVSAHFSRSGHLPTAEQRLLLHALARRAGRLLLPQSEHPA